MIVLNRRQIRVRKLHDNRLRTKEPIVSEQVRRYLPCATVSLKINETRNHVMTQRVVPDTIRSAEFGKTGELRTVNGCMVRGGRHGDISQVQIRKGHLAGIDAQVVTRKAAGKNGRISLDGDVAHGNIDGVCLRRSAWFDNHRAARARKGERVRQRVSMRGIESLRDWNNVLTKWYASDGAGVFPDPRAADEVNEPLQTCEVD